MGDFLDEMDDVCMCFDCNWYFCFDQIHFVKEGDIKTTERKIGIGIPKKIIINLFKVYGNQLIQSEFF